MDLEKPSEQDWLQKWRIRAGLPEEAVDRALDLPQGTTGRYESVGLVRVPAFHLSKLVGIYRINPEEFLGAIHEASFGIRPKKR